MAAPTTSLMTFFKVLSRRVTALFTYLRGWKRVRLKREKQADPLNGTSTMSFIKPCILAPALTKHAPQRELLPFLFALQR